MMNFLVNLFDFVLKMVDFVLNLLDFVLKLLDFAGHPWSRNARRSVGPRCCRSDRSVCRCHRPC